MSTLTEIEAAADTLSDDEKEQLFHYLSVRLRNNDGMPKSCPSSDVLPEVGEPATAARPQGKAREWMQTAKGSVRVAGGASADEARIAYYTAKYGMTH